MNDDFRDILSLLLEHQADFIVVGAHAMAVHGAARATGDIDVLVRPTLPNAERVCAALREFGAPLRLHGVVGRDELLRNKAAAGRPKDLADIALLDEASDEGGDRE